MTKSPEYKTPDQDYHDMTYRTEREDIRSQNKSLEILKEKYERDKNEYVNIQKRIYNLLHVYFALPRDAKNFDIDYLITRLKTNQDSMTQTQRSILIDVENLNEEMKQLSDVHMKLSDVKIKLNQLENDERLLEARKYLPKNFPKDILKYVVGPMITGSNRRKTRKRKGSNMKKTRKRKGSNMKKKRKRKGSKSRKYNKHSH